MIERCCELQCGLSSLTVMTQVPCDDEALLEGTNIFLCPSSANTLLEQYSFQVSRRVWIPGMLFGMGLCLRAAGFWMAKLRINQGAGDLQLSHLTR